MKLTPSEDRRALFEEGAGAFADVFGGEEGGEEFGFEAECFVEGEARAAGDGFEAGAGGQGRGRVGD